MSKPGKILEDFFESIQFYVRDLINEEKNLMDGLTNFVIKAWEVQKKFKGNSDLMAFIPEYLVFETVKQYIGIRKHISFLPLVRTRTFEGLEETDYFIDSQEEPTHLLCQGLRIHSDKTPILKLPKLDYAHDICYLIKKNDWLVKAIFEAKSYFDTPGLEGDIMRLSHAEQKYPLAENFALVFVGFKRQDWITKKEKTLISSFTEENNHFCVLPGEINSVLGNSRLE